jgi:hypothetical protein
MSFFNYSYLKKKLTEKKRDKKFPAFAQETNNPSVFFSLDASIKKNSFAAR